jgi:hypothetical protein
MVSFGTDRERSGQGHGVGARFVAGPSPLRAVRTIPHRCRVNRRRAIAEQHAVLSQKVRGRSRLSGCTRRVPHPNVPSNPDKFAMAGASRTPPAAATSPRLLVGA